VSGKGKILVVDDDRLVLATLTHGLSQAGYQVIDADNGDEAILLARQHKPDLALLDIRMEGKTGFDVAVYLRDYCHVPFMFLSAFSDDDTVAQVKALGALAYLVKPLDIHQIVPAIEAALANLARHKEAHPPAALDGHSLRHDVLSNGVAIAVGVLMHRFSIHRTTALNHLTRLAASEGQTLEAQSEQLMQAVEVLARPAAPQ
jgi:DNA-binding response OmpR family regulator